MGQYEGDREHGMIVPLPVASLWHWKWEAPIAIAIVAAQVAFTGMWIRRRASSPDARPRRSALVAFTIGLAVIGLSIMSPIGANDELLLSMHMLEHDLLIWVAAPLLLVGVIPLRARGRAAPARERSLVRVGTHPVVALGISSAVLWAWHLPWAYDRALRSETVHALEHASFLGAYVLYWWPIMAPASLTLWLRGNASRVVYLLAGATQSAILASLIAFHADVLYATYTVAPRVTSLSPLADQRLAGMLMLFPGVVVHVIAAIYLLKDE
jgi:cytochrome c oxidase assembly factor CtaG